MSNLNATEVVVGAGAVGQAVARRLVAEGVGVRLASRHGTPVAGADRRAVDVSDREAAQELIAGASVVYFCAEPPLWAWRELFPPLQESVMAAAEAAGALLVSAEPLYAYGAVNGPIHEGLPLAAHTHKGMVRAAMAQQLLEAHRTGRLRTALVRASDLYGPGVRNAFLGTHLFPALLAGKTARVLGDPDMPHTYTFVDDFAAAMVTVAHDERGSGGVWHAPNAPTRSTRDLLTDAARLAGTSLKLAKSPRPVLQAMGVFNREVGELVEMVYQWQAPFVVDHTKFVQGFGDISTAAHAALERTVSWWQAEIAGSPRPVSAIAHATPIESAHPQ
jgi:nucleoside-diphosphate-sugar epimerase